MIPDNRLVNDRPLLMRIFSSAKACYLIPFVVLGGHLAYVILTNQVWEPTGYYLIHYLYTYDHGFVARGLVGEIISWFTDTVTDDMIRTVITVFAALLMLSFALCAGKALNKVRNDEKRLKYVCAIIVILCMLPMFLDTYYKDIKLDKMLWVLTFFAVFLSDRKYGIWLVPVLCVTATLINPVFLFCSMILISIILLQEFYSSNLSVKNGVICAVSYISMIVVGLYGTVSEKWLNFSSPREMVDYYFSRYSGALTDYEYERFETEWLFDYFEPIENIYKLSYEIYFKDWGNGIICIFNFIFVAIPVYLLLSIFWKNVIKSESNKFQKFIYFLCAVSPIVIIPPVSISWEFSKYLYNNVIMQLCLIVYFLVKGNTAVFTATENVLEYGKKHAMLSALITAYFSGICVYYSPIM